MSSEETPSSLVEASMAAAVTSRRRRKPKNVLHESTNLYPKQQDIVATETDSIAKTNTHTNVNANPRKKSSRGNINGAEKASIQAEESSEQNVRNRLRGNGNVSNGNANGSGNGDEITPRISNRHKVEQQHRSVQSSHTQQFGTGAVDEQWNKSIFSPKSTHLDGRTRNECNSALEKKEQQQQSLSLPKEIKQADLGHESDCSMDCSSDSLGLDSSSDADAESTCSNDNGNGHGDDTDPCSKLMGGEDNDNSDSGKTDASNFYERNINIGSNQGNGDASRQGQKQMEKQEHTICKNKNEEQHSRKSRLRSKELALDSSNIIDSNGCPIVSKGLLQRARNTKADNGHVLQVLMDSCGGAGKRVASASSWNSNLTLCSATLLGATIPIKRCDSKESILTMSIDGDGHHGMVKHDDPKSAWKEDDIGEIAKKRKKRDGNDELNGNMREKNSKLATTTMTLKDASSSKVDHKKTLDKSSASTNRFNDAQTLQQSRRKFDDRDDDTVQTIDSENGSVVTHPKLPPGWRVKVSRSKNKAYYVHPDFGSTWHCPVVSKHPVEICPHEKSRMSEHDEEGETCTSMEQGDNVRHSYDGDHDNGYTEEETFEHNALPKGAQFSSRAKSEIQYGTRVESDQEDEKDMMETENATEDVVAVHRQGGTFEIYKDPVENIISKRKTYGQSVATIMSSKASKNLQLNSSNEKLSAHEEGIYKDPEEHNISKRKSFDHSVAATSSQAPKSLPKLNWQKISTHEEGADAARSSRFESDNKDNPLLSPVANSEKAHDEGSHDFSAGCHTGSESESSSQNAMNDIDSADRDGKRDHYTSSKDADEPPYFSTNSAGDSEHSPISNTQDSPRYLDFGDETEIRSQSSGGFHGSTSKSSASMTGQSYSSTKSSLEGVEKQKRGKNGRIVVSRESARETIADRMKRLVHPICSLQRLDEIIKAKEAKKAAVRLHRVLSTRKRRGKVKVAYGRKR